MLLLLMGAAVAAQFDPNVVIGRWRTEVRHGVVEISRCGPSICGKLIDSDGLKADPNLLDTNNKDTKLRTRRLMGVQMLQGFTWKDGAWNGGTIYNGEDGGTYKATVTPVSNTQLKLKGCIVWPLCKTQTWTKLP
ncbi:MAG TPA: DUF2147 domain-containing protein [Sphingobium sp.]|uniref:DUF2147 domain-containing protein n=1 Tax=Sphingobium sp. TaxID=1912891 RepID=UPI002ED20635